MAPRFFTQDLPGTPAPPPFRCRLRMTQCMAHGKNGQRCRRKTFRHPFCMHHVRSICGVEVKRSPVAGCGLFAHRDLAVGDVLLPYTGDEFANVGELYARQGRHGTPYAMALGRGRLVDSSCLRGLAAYANAPTRRQQQANLTGMQMTLQWPQDARLFGPEDPATGLCPVLSPGVLRRTNRFWERRWRRIPAQVLRRFAGKSYHWIVVSRPVAAGEELFLPYNNASVNFSDHRTWPMPC